MIQIKNVSNTNSSGDRSCWLHGSSVSRVLRAMAEEIEVRVKVTLIDGPVRAHLGLSSFDELTPSDAAQQKLSPDEG